MRVGNGPVAKVQEWAEACQHRPMVLLRLPAIPPGVRCGFMVHNGNLAPDMLAGVKLPMIGHGSDGRVHET